MERITCETTKKSLPALWESGGGRHNTGNATIICDPAGNPKTPVYIRTSGHLANDQHALFIVAVGDMVVMSDHHRKDHITQIYRLAKITFEGGFHRAYLELQAEFSSGEWSDETMALRFDAAVRAAQVKAESYHCREPIYIASQPAGLTADTQGASAA